MGVDLVTSGNPWCIQNGWIGGEKTNREGMFKDFLDNEEEIQKCLNKVYESKGRGRRK